MQLDCKQAVNRILIDSKLIDQIHRKINISINLPVIRTACINFKVLRLRFCLWKCQRRPVFYIPVMTFGLHVTFWLSFYAAKRILCCCLIQAWIISSIWHNNVMILWRWQTLKSIILTFIFWAQLRHKCEPPRATPTLLHSRWASQLEKHRCTNCACVVHG